MECRVGCAACCTVISISSPLPGFPKGKAPGIPCGALGSDGTCTIWGSDAYPRVCRNFKADAAFCGSNNAEARVLLAELEKATSG